MVGFNLFSVAKQTSRVDGLFVFLELISFVIINAIEIKFMKR